MRVAHSRVAPAVHTIGWPKGSPRIRPCEPSEAIQQRHLRRRLATLGRFAALAM